MKLTPMERCAVALGVVVFIGGFAEVLWPHVGLVPHDTSYPKGGHTSGWMQPMTRNSARVAGVLAMVAGVGIVAFTVYERE